MLLLKDFRVSFIAKFKSQLSKNAKLLCHDILVKVFHIHICILSMLGIILIFLAANITRLIWGKVKQTI